LHFEIRDQFFENTLNPLLFGYAERDVTPPNMTALAIIPKKGEGKVNNLDNLIGAVSDFNDSVDYVKNTWPI
jgi:hypothetical protein